eukprot:scaffold70035_cov65-Phaeocystis_antarctica.AAC.5
MQRSRASRTSSAALLLHSQSCCGSHKAPRTARPQRGRSNRLGCRSLRPQCGFRTVPPAWRVPLRARRGSCRMRRCQTRAGDVQATRRIPMCRRTWSNCTARSTRLRGQKHRQASRRRRHTGRCNHEARVPLRSRARRSTAPCERPRARERGSKAGCGVLRAGDR